MLRPTIYIPSHLIRLIDPGMYQLVQAPLEEVSPLFLRREAKGPLI